MWHEHAENEYTGEDDALLLLPDQLEDAFRGIGLYSPSTTIIPGDKPLISMTFLIGDVAFTDRVQHPEQFDFDVEFRMMTRDLTADEFESIRKELS